MNYQRDPGHAAKISDDGVEGAREQDVGRFQVGMAQSSSVDDFQSFDDVAQDL